MTKIASWIESYMPSNKPQAGNKAALELDSLQNDAIKQLKEGREFMVSAIESISSRYNNEQKVR